MNKVVARYRDGRLAKGITEDFSALKEAFHLIPHPGGPGERSVEIRLADLKALFFVWDLFGDAHRRKRNSFEPGKPVPGRKIQVTFEDGEVMVGTTQGYQPGRPGFFVTPADTDSNIERCYVVTASTRQVTLL